VLSAPLGFGQFSLRECYKGYSGWPDLAVVGKLGRPFVTRTWYWFASTPIADTMINDFLRRFVLAASDKI